PLPQGVDHHRRSTCAAAPANPQLMNDFAGAAHLNSACNEIADNCRYRSVTAGIGVGDNAMRHRAIPAATMIVAAGLIGITQARLPRPIRDYRDRVSVETSQIDLVDIPTDSLGIRLRH